MNGARLTGLRNGLARLRGREIEVKTSGELDVMRAAGAVVARTLAALTGAARPGVSTAELDQIAEQSIRDTGAVPSFYGYLGYPASICASVNEQIVHGIPAPGRLLADGDLLSIDCGAVVDGWHGDAAVTVEVGAVGDADRALNAACHDALAGGIAAVRADARLTDISAAVQQATEQAAERDGAGYGIVAEYGGHGIGSSMHMEPFVPNLGPPGRGPRLRPGMVLAIEPMLTAGAPRTKELADGWTVVTADGSRAVHWEHSVAVTEDGPWVLTSLPVP